MAQEKVKIVPGASIALPPLSETASSRRTLDEHLLVRFPALFRLLSAAFMRLPPRSRLRRVLLARRMTRAYAAYNRRDFDLILTGWIRRPSTAPKPSW